jgi:hypothetical protein
MGLLEESCNKMSTSFDVGEEEEEQQNVSLLAAMNMTTSTSTTKSVPTQAVATTTVTTQVLHLAEISDVDSESGSEKSLKEQETKAPEDSDSWLIEKEDEASVSSHTGTNCLGRGEALNLDRYAHALSDDEDDESKSKTSKSEQYFSSADSTEGADNDQNDGVVSEDNDDLRKPNKWLQPNSNSSPTKQHEGLVQKNTMDSCGGDTTESTVATQDDEDSSQGSECETSQITSTSSTLETSTTAAPVVAPAVPVLDDLLQSYRDAASLKTIAQLIRQDLMGSSTSTIHVKVALDEFAARSSTSTNTSTTSNVHVRKNRAAIARTGGLLAIVQTMERLSEDKDVQVSACLALEKLALDAENETAIADVGGVEAILAAMMTHYTDVAVHEAAWGALWNLSCRNADSVMTVDTAGGMEAIIAAMQHHVDSPAIQRNACGTLANLCVSNDARRTALAKSGGFVAVAAALQRHWDDQDVKNEASYALTALLEDSARHYDVNVVGRP